MSDNAEGTTQKPGVPDNTFEDEAAIADALLSKWEPDALTEPSDTEEEPKKPKAKEPAVASDDEPADDGQEVEEEAEEPKEDEETERKFVESDDVYVKVKVGDEEHEVSVKDLRRLAGQEASLTRKGQELATARKATEDFANLQVGVFDKLLESAREAFKPFQNLDLVALARNPEVTEGQIEAIRSEAQRRYQELQFLESGLQQITEASQKAVGTKKAEAAKACIEALSDPTTGIEGWGEPLYNDIVKYAVEQGVSKDVLTDLTDPGTYKLYRKAMLYDQAKTKVTQIKDEKKKASPPKKIIKSTKQVTSSKDRTSDNKIAAREEALRKRGHVDDAAALLEARWSVGEDDE